MIDGPEILKFNWGPEMKMCLDRDNNEIECKQQKEIFVVNFIVFLFIKLNLKESYIFIKNHMPS